MHNWDLHKLDDQIMTEAAIYPQNYFVEHHPCGMGFVRGRIDIHNPSIPSGVVYICQKCGDIWAKVETVALPMDRQRKGGIRYWFGTIRKDCEFHGDGSLITTVNTWGELPREAKIREVDLAFKRRFNQNLLQLATARSAQKFERRYSKETSDAVHGATEPGH